MEHSTAHVLQVVMGKPVRRPTTINLEVAKEILSCQDDDSFQTVLAGTMCTDDFYEGQLKFTLVVANESTV